MSAEIITLSLAEQREQDRRRYPDPAFNRWLDEGISDSGHTVWDAIGDTGAAWAGWENRAYYDDKLCKWVHDPDIERLREAARMALEAIRRLTASEDITYLRGSVALALVEAEGALVDALREALGEKL